MLMWNQHGHCDQHDMKHTQTHKHTHTLTHTHNHTHTYKTKFLSENPHKEHARQMLMGRG